MDKIRYDFDLAIRQINQVRKLNENAQECLRQAKRARILMMDLGNGEVVRLLTEALENRIRQGEKICDRLEHLENALRKNLSRFEAVEADLTRSIQGIGQETGRIVGNGTPVLWSKAQCLVGQLRFADVIYPEFLSQAAEKYFASTL